jgi:hypothetical protein
VKETREGKMVLETPRGGLQMWYQKTVLLQTVFLRLAGLVPSRALPDCSGCF